MSDQQPLTRPNFFSGRLLTADALTQEQTYFLEKGKRHNRHLHGIGIVFGLRVTAGSGKISVSPGMALDCEGNEIVITSNESVSPTLPADARIAYVNVRYCESSGETSTAGEALTITEGFELILGKKNENRGHRHLKARWLACGKAHALTLAKLRRGPHGWRVDRAYHSPAIK